MNEGIVHQVLEELKKITANNNAAIKNNERILKEFDEHARVQLENMSQAANDVFDKRVKELPCSSHVGDIKEIKKELLEHDDEIKDLKRRVARTEKATPINRIHVVVDDFWQRHAYTIYGRIIRLSGLIGVLIFVMHKLGI
jgi:predicted RNase H-like nuclease (RuvC/YqgF family)